MKSLFIVMLLLVTLSSYGQTNVPAAVADAFYKTFPGVNATWEEEAGRFEADFKQKGKTMSATYEANGKWLKTETVISANKLPATVIDYLEENYAGSQVKKASILAIPSGEMYEAEINGKYLLFDMTGKFLKASEY